MAGCARCADEEYRQAKDALGPNDGMIHTANMWLRFSAREPGANRKKTPLPRRYPLCSASVVSGMVVLTTGSPISRIEVQPYTPSIAYGGAVDLHEFLHLVPASRQSAAESERQGFRGLSRVAGYKG
jgi:hypothetical protein